MKIEAAQRLVQSMPIKDGDNYSQGLYEANNLLEYEMSDFTFVNFKNGMLLLRTTASSRTEQSLLLLKTRNTSHSLFDAKSTALLKTIAVEPVATITSWHYSTRDEMDTSWVSKEYRGKGYGKAMYKALFHFANKSLRSSTSLGTMSLAVWISLYKEYKQIYILYKGTYCERSDIKINGLKIFNTQLEIEITSPKAAQFVFVWPK